MWSTVSIQRNRLVAELRVSRTQKAGNDEFVAKNCSEYASFLSRLARIGPAPISRLARASQHLPGPADQLERHPNHSMGLILLLRRYQFCLFCLNIQKGAWVFRWRASILRVTSNRAALHVVS